jgi:hypothetical protein
MKHNGYFYPEDIVVTTVDGSRVAQINLDAPTIWTPEAISAAGECWLCGWEMARRAHEKAAHDEWYQRVYPDHWAEHLRFKAWLAAGGSVTGYHGRAT